MTTGENMQISLKTLRFNRVTFHERLVSKCTFLGSRNPMKLFSRHKEKKVLTSHYCQKGEKIITLISLTVNKTYDAQTLTHHQCCLLEALGVYFLVRNSQAFRTWLIKSCPVSKCHGSTTTALPSSTRAIWRIFLLPSHCFLWLLLR